MQLNSYLNRVKKLLVFSLLFLLLFNFMGYYFIFEVNRYQIRKEMKSASSGSHIISVIEILDSDSVSGLRWVDKHEFVYRGNMYDVIYTSQRSTKTVYYCIHDKKEESLVKAFQHANTSKLTLALWNLMVHMAIPLPTFTLESEPPILVIYQNLTMQLCNVNIQPDSPPPQYLSQSLPG